MLDCYEVEVVRYYCTSNNNEEFLSLGRLRLKLHVGTCEAECRQEWKLFNTHSEKMAFRHCLKQNA
jgi:hypothetical protein